MTKKIIIVAAAFMLSGCYSSKPTTTTATTSTFTTDDVNRGAAKFPGLTAVTLQEGRMQYEQNCAKCHGLKKVDSRTEEQWNHILPPMAKKAQISAETEASISKYLLTMCKK